VSSSSRNSIAGPKTAENGKKTADISLFFGGSKRPESRIYAAKAIRFAVNFVEEQRKQQDALDCTP